MTAVCAVDVGSSMIKVAVYDPELRVCARISRGFPAVRSPGRSEVDPGRMWTVVGQCIRDGIAASPVEPDRLALTTQMAGLILLDRNGSPIGPGILGIDNRGQEFAADTDPRTGCPPGGIYPAQKLRWIGEHEPARLAAAHRIGGIKEYLLLRLTGRWVTDRSSASATGLYDQKQEAWLARDPGRFPEIAPARETAGPVDPAITGLPRPIPVTVGVGDGPAASIASGSVGPRRLCLSVGTTIVARLLVDDRPKDGGLSFVQQLDGGWHSIGMRFDLEEPGVYSAIGIPGTRLGATEIPEMMAPLIATYGVRELRPVTSRRIGADLARDWRMPVRLTDSYDGTRGAALLATDPGTLPELAERVGVTEEFRPPVKDSR